MTSKEIESTFVKLLSSCFFNVFVVCRKSWQTVWINGLGSVLQTVGVVFSYEFKSYSWLEHSNTGRHNRVAQ